MPAGGVLMLGSPLALQRSTLDLSGGSLSLGTLTASTLGGLGGGPLGLTNGSQAAVALTVGGNAAAMTYGGTLSGPRSLTKTGSGTFWLTGASNYSGPTTLAAGGLVVDGVLYVSAVTVQSGGTLGGTGSLSSVTVSPSGQIAPGDPLGALSNCTTTTLAEFFASAQAPQRRSGKALRAIAPAPGRGARGEKSFLPLDMKPKVCITMCVGNNLRPLRRRTLGCGPRVL